jgi:hypothetical protein
VAPPRWQEEQQAFQAEVFRVVREASNDIVAEGMARLEEGDDAGGVYLRLTPVNPRAAPITVYPDYPTLSIGTEGHTTEMFGPQDVRLGELRQLIRAVIAGRYEWEQRQVPRRFLFLRLGTFTRLVGTFHTDTGPWVFTRQGAEPLGAVQRGTYEPYST